MEEILSRLKGFNPPDRCTVEDREAAEAIQGAIAEIERLRGEVVMEGEPGHETTWKKEAKSLFAMTERLRKLLETIRDSAIYSECFVVVEYAEKALKEFGEQIPDAPKTSGNALFDFLHDQHGLTLVDDELEQIISAVHRYEEESKPLSFPDPAMAIHNEESEKGLLEIIKRIHRSNSADPTSEIRILEVEDCAGCPRNDGEICGLDTEVSTKSFLDGSFPARCPLEIKKT